MLPMNIDPKIQAMGIYIGYPLHGDKSRTSRTKRDFPCITQKIAIPSLILCGHMILYQKCSWLKFPISFLMMPRSRKKIQLSNREALGPCCPRNLQLCQNMKLTLPEFLGRLFRNVFPKDSVAIFGPPTKTSHIYILSTNCIYTLRIHPHSWNRIEGSISSE